MENNLGIVSQKIRCLLMMFALEVRCVFVECAIELSIASGNMEFGRMCAIELSIASGTGMF
jgi:hypothetical protein